MWPIYYAMASDSAEERATSTANGIITTAMFIGGGIRHCLWAGSFSLAAAGKIQRVISTPSLPWRDALLGMLLQLATTDKNAAQSALTQRTYEDCYRAGFV